ncbi:MAG: hypothetical protein CV045_08425 [Cyanobacteria bacterium M5B4]|nr:MAG: hypothetical protein CV045_08425 [Cyanobacteria bacterium M5B4]
MEPRYQVGVLSSIVNGSPLIVSASSYQTAQILHQSANSPDIEELWIDAYNFSESLQFLSVFFAGMPSGQEIVYPIIPRSGLVPIFKGRRLTNGASLLVFASAPSTIGIMGEMNRIVTS